MTDNFLDPGAVIIGAEKIISIYGKWPDLHDFEIPKIVFERNLPEDEFGPFLTVFVHMWQAADGGYGKHNVVGIRFNKIIEHDSVGFNHQNVIDDMEIMASEDNAGNIIFKVTIPSIFGFGTELTCHSIEIISVEPGAPPHSQYERI
jgi:hypothetical protein